MAVIVCLRCQMPFRQKKDEEYCPLCSKGSEDTFGQIKDYLMKNQGASATELVNALGVTIKQIQYYLREERLEVTGGGASGLRCDGCGVAIQSGRLCEVCAKKSEQRRKAERSEAANKALMENREENLKKSAYRYQNRDSSGRHK